MTGVAAVAMCAAFTSCSKSGDELYDQGVVDGQKVESFQDQYAKAFTKFIGGQVGANVDWGFGAKAKTRSNTGDTYPQTEAYHNMNHNEWADPDKEFGGYTVPDPLTTEQKAVVAAYFQSVPNLTYSDPGLRHFFVQQVYKGGAGEVRNTTEGITAADGSKYNSDNMNLLSVGQANIHINDFNAGSCSSSNVLDNGQHVGGSSHSDQITLMVNIDDTSCFGYHETGSSTQHNNKAALVSWQTIRDWANSNGLNGNCLNDKWNRSFLGFDLAIKEGAQAYATDEAGNVQYADYSQAPESPAYAWDGEKVFPIKQITEIQHEYWVEKIVGDYLDEYKNIMKGSEALGWLTTNKNFYVAADYVTLNQSYQNGETKPADLSEAKNAVIIKDLVYNGEKYQAVLNLAKINQLIANDYLPVNNKSLQEWVKVGKSDGYFSDWIVTLTEATREVPSTPTYRVIAEDLSAQGDTDFDFNDVVFDVEPNEAGTAAKITVMAAGGIYQLKVDGVEVHEALLGGNGQLGEDGLYPMINTGDGPQVDPVVIRTAYAGDFSSDAAIRATIQGITVKVWKPRNKDSEDVVECTLSANRGEPASKVLVDKSFEIVPEHHSIADQNGKFTNYARGEWADDFWWKK